MNRNRILCQCYFIYCALSLLPTYDTIAAPPSTRVDLVNASPNGETKANITYPVINAKDFGANGEDNIDDWAALQKAVDYLANQGGGTLNIPNGKYIINDKSLIIWGNNINVVGESRSNTIIEKRGAAGWWGDAVDISGKLTGYKYYGSFGKTDYNRFIIYNGSTEIVNNVSLKNLTVRTNSASVSNRANNLGITNAKNVVINNCSFYNAPQSNVAIINIANKSKNGLITLSDCSFSASGAHNVRVISYNEGNILGNQVVIERCNFSNVKNKERSFKEINGKAVHLWYRAGKGSNAISLNVNDCNFDSSGEIVGTGNINGFSILNSTIKSKIDLSESSRLGSGAVRIQNNKFLNNSIGSPLIKVKGTKNTKISGNVSGEGQVLINGQKILVE